MLIYSDATTLILSVRQHRPDQRLRRRRTDLRPPHLADQDRLHRQLHPRRHQPRPIPLRLHRLGTRHHRPGQPPAQLLALRSRHPAHRRQPRRPPHPRPPRPRPGKPRPRQHRPGHHRDHPRERLTTTTRPPPRQPEQHQAPPAPPAGPFPSPVMPTQRDADVPNQRVAEHLRPRGAGLIIVHCGAFRRTVAHHAVISARRAASSFVGMCVPRLSRAHEHQLPGDLPAGEVGRDEPGGLEPRYPRISGPRESVTLDR